MLLVLVRGQDLASISYRPSRCHSWAPARLGGPGRAGCREVVPVPNLRKIASHLDELRDFVASSAADDPRPAGVHPDHLASATNMAHYLALRQRDIRPLQRELAEVGLSSLGRAEGHILASVDLVREAVASLADLRAPRPRQAPVDLPDSLRLLGENADQLLGPAQNGRRTRIMVTLPSEAATDPDLVDRIIEAGAEVVRINTAHDGPDAWRSMVDHVRAADARLGRRTTVTMDLAGPKVRTGPVRSGPSVVKVRPRRDRLGRVTQPRPVRLHADDAQDGTAGATGSGPETVDDTWTVSLPVRDAAWLAARAPGERLTLRDARGSSRDLTVLQAGPDGVLAEAVRTAYLVPGTVLTAPDGTSTEVGDLPAVEQKLRLFVGDELLVVADLEPVDPEAVPRRIGCTLPEVLEDVAVGDRIFFDDGKIGGEVVGRVEDGLRVRIVDASPRGTRLAAEKGINLPDTALRLPALTPEDDVDLGFLVEHADVVSLSFVRRAGDVALLQDRLADLGRPDMGVILKVETVEGFRHLPEILFQALKSPSRSYGPPRCSTAWQRRGAPPGPRSPTPRCPAGPSA